MAVPDPAMLERHLSMLNDARPDSMSPLHGPTDHLPRTAPLANLSWANFAASGTPQSALELGPHSHQFWNHQFDQTD